MNVIEFILIIRNLKNSNNSKSKNSKHEAVLGKITGTTSTTYHGLKVQKIYKKGTTTKNVILFKKHEQVESLSVHHY